MTTLTTLQVYEMPMGKLLGVIAANINDNIIEPWMIEAVCRYVIFSVLRRFDEDLIDDGYDLVTVGTVRRWRKSFFPDSQ